MVPGKVGWWSPPSSPRPRPDRLSHSPPARRHCEQGHQEYAAGPLQLVSKAQAERKPAQRAPWIPELIPEAASRSLPAHQPEGPGGPCPSVEPASVRCCPSRRPMLPQRRASRRPMLPQLPSDACAPPHPRSRVRLSTLDSAGMRGSVSSHPRPHSVYMNKCYFWEGSEEAAVSWERRFHPHGYELPSPLPPT